MENESSNSAPFPLLFRFLIYLPPRFPSSPRKPENHDTANLTSPSLVASSLTLFPENLTSFLPAKPICSVALDPVSSLSLYLTSHASERAQGRFSRPVYLLVPSHHSALYPRDVPDVCSNPYPAARAQPRRSRLGERPR